MLPSSGGVCLLVEGGWREERRGQVIHKEILCLSLLDTLLCGRIQLCHQPKSESARGCNR